MKSILIPVEEHVLIHPVLETALLLGRVLDGYLEGLAITPNTPPYIASDIAIGDLSFLDPELRRERATASRRLFETFMTAQGVPRFDAESTGLSFGWRRIDLEDDDFVGSYGRAFDIIVLGTAQRSAQPPAPAIGRSRAVRERPAGSARAADRTRHSWYDSGDCLEQKHGDGPHGGPSHAASGRGATDRRDRL